MGLKSLEYRATRRDELTELLLTGGVQNIVAIVVHLVDGDGVGEGEGVVERGCTGALRHLGVLRGIGEDYVRAALEPLVHLGVDGGLAGVTGIAGSGGGTLLVEVTS